MRPECPFCESKNVRVRKKAAKPYVCNRCGEEFEDWQVELGESSANGKLVVGATAGAELTEDWQLDYVKKMAREFDENDKLRAPGGPERAEALEIMHKLLPQELETSSGCGAATLGLFGGFFAGPFLASFFTSDSNTIMMGGSVVGIVTALLGAFLAVWLANRAENANKRKRAQERESIFQVNPEFRVLEDEDASFEEQVVAAKAVLKRLQPAATGEEDQ